MRTELTPAGYVKEMLHALNSKREESGYYIEMEVAMRKLIALSNPDTKRELNDAFIERLTSNVDDTVPLSFKYSREDCQEAIRQRLKTGKGIERIREKLKREIKEEWDQTSKAYEELEYQPETDPFWTANERHERGFLADLIGYLGYQVEHVGEGQFRIYPPSPHEINDDIETLIYTKLNGVYRLIFDYEFTYFGEIRRPVLRQAIALTEQMVLSLRQQ